MNQHRTLYHRRFSLHASNITRLAEDNRHKGVIDVFDDRKKSVLAPAGQDTFNAFRSGFFSDPEIGTLCGVFAWYHFDNLELGGSSYDDYARWVDEALRQYWYSTGTTAPYRPILSDQEIHHPTLIRLPMRISVGEAINRFYDETIDLANLMIYLADGASGEADDGRKALYSRLLKIACETELGGIQTTESDTSLARVCGMACIDNRFAKFIDPLMQLADPLDDDEEKKKSVLKEIMQALEVLKIGENPAFIDTYDAKQLMKTKSDTTFGRWMAKVNASDVGHGKWLLSDVEAAIRLRSGES